MRTTTGLKIGLACLGAIAGTPAHAALVCTITTTVMSFGSYNPLQTGPVDITATLEVTCTVTGILPALILATVTLNGATTGGQRQIKNGVVPLNYQLFSDSARATAWGDGTGGSVSKAVSGLAGIGAPYHTTLTVYGRLLARQPGATVGLYNDQISVSIAY